MGLHPKYSVENGVAHLTLLIRDLKMGRFAVKKLFDCLKVIKIGSEIGTEPRMSAEKVVPEVSINRVQYKSNSAEARATMIKCTNLLF